MIQYSILDFVTSLQFSGWVERALQKIWVWKDAITLWLWATDNINNNKKNIYCWCFKLHWLWRKYCALATNDIFPKTSKKAEIVTSSVIKAWQIQKDHFTTFEIMWLYLGKLKHSVGFSILTKTLIHTHAHALIHTLIRFDWVYLNRKRPLYNVLESQKNFY